MIPLTLCLALAAAFSDPGSAALFTWADFDGDQLLDLAAVDSQGRLQLLADTGDGRFEDVTERFGVADVENAALALWADYDADGRLDLFVGAREGTSRLFHNDGGVFVDVGATSGLASKGPVLSAHWLDHDGDGWLDLHVVTAEANELYHGLEGGFFEVTVLPAFVAPPSDPGPLAEREAPEPEAPRAPPPSPGASGADQTRDRLAPPRDPRSGALSAVQGPTISSSPLPPFNILACTQSIKDQANLSSCLQASTTPTLGLLYPLSANLFVAISGNVGIGTTSPVAKLDVAGTARISDTLTLAPSGDQALDLSTGSLYKGGALFMHTKGGIGNTGLGREALGSVTTGIHNTASGYRALFSNTTGIRNTASGYRALYLNTTGYQNTASGDSALSLNTTGIRNTASGHPERSTPTRPALATLPAGIGRSPPTRAAISTSLSVGMQAPS